MLIRHLQNSGVNGNWYIIYDNAPIHGTVAETMLREAGFFPLRLPAWSPFLNPIEESFSKLKSGVKRDRLADHDNLLSRISVSANAITREDCVG